MDEGKDDNIGQIAKALAAFFREDEIEWKVTSYNNKDRRQATKALVVPYVQARAIMNRLDDVMGIAGWTDKYEPGPNGGIICGISLYLGTTWLTKWDGADNTEINPIKGGITAAFKRAAVRWGIGRYLYLIPKAWVDIKNGNPDSEQMKKLMIPSEFLPPKGEAKKKEKESGKPAQTTKEATQATPTAEVLTIDSLEQAFRIIIPADIGLPQPLVGKSLEETLDDKVFGPAVILWLAGVEKNQAGNAFEPKTQEQGLLQYAANLIRMEKGITLPPAGKAKDK